MEKKDTLRKARYGCITSFADVTGIIQAEWQKKRDVPVTNQSFRTDPCPGHTKFLQLEYADGSVYYIAENGVALCSETKHSGDVQPGMCDLVTFIIPTIGRPTLLMTLQSLENMHSTAWNAIVVFDGCTPHSTINHWRESESSRARQFTYLPITKVGFRNCAGAVRNVGIARSETPWIAFVDDDDVVTCDYMLRLETEIREHPNADVIVFRMLQLNSVLPSAGTVALHEVGISFAMRRSLAATQSFWFEPSPSEDFNLLSKLLRAGKNIHVSHFITYLVRPPPPNSDEN